MARVDQPSKNGLTKMVANMERELLELKAAQRGSPLVKGYSYQCTLNQVGRWRIDYAEGTMPVMTEVMIYAGATSTVNGTTQYFWHFSNAGSWTCQIVSNRPILAVTYDPES